MLRCDMVDGCHNNSFLWTSDIGKIVWYEIPKNASSSMKVAMKKKYIDFDRIEKLTEKHNDYTKICIVRNPFDRMVSNWRMYCFGQSKGDVIKEIFNIKNKEITFSEFVEKSITMRNHHWENQTTFIYDNNKCLVDKIYKMEELTGKELGINLPNFNKSNRVIGYREYYTEELIKIVETEYKSDIENFNYKY